MNARHLIETEADPEGYSEFEQGVLVDRDRKRDLQWQRYVAVKDLLDRGMTFKAIGQKYNISASQARAIYLRGERMAQRANTPEQQLSGRAWQWLTNVLGVKTGREAVERLAEIGPMSLRKYRGFGPKLYAELRHWAKRYYGVEIGTPHDMASYGYSSFNKLIPKPNDYQI